MKILFTGGGTAGHVFPIIAVVREMNRMGLRAEYSFIGPKDDFNSIVLSHERIKIKTIFAGKIRRYVNWKSILENIRDIGFFVPLGFIQSFFYIFFHSPDLIFSKGGYGSLAPAFSAWLLGVPIVLHESDASPGLANRIISKLVKKVLISFPLPHTEYFSAEKMISVGNPIRRELLAGSIEKGKKLFNLTGEKPIILIIGGSQGAQPINDLVLNFLAQIIEIFEVIHQTGEKNYEQIKTESKIVITKENDKYYHPVPFLKEIELRDAYAVADIIISRAGSGSIFEIAAIGKPSILIPLPNSAQDHQIKNAYIYGDKKAAIVMEKENLTPNFLLEKLKLIFADPKELEIMAENAKKFAKPESARIVAEYIVNMLS